MTEEAIILAPGAGSTVLLRGTEVVFKAAGKRSAGGPTIMEFKVVPGYSTGDHVHGSIEEAFYVLDGRLNIRAGDQLVEATRGRFVAVPPGVAHGFGNPGNEPATLLVVISPAGVHESYFEELAAILAKPGPPDGAAIADLRRRYDTTQVSPLIPG